MTKEQVLEIIEKKKETYHEEALRHYETMQKLEFKSEKWWDAALDCTSAEAVADALYLLGLEIDNLA